MVIIEMNPRVSRSSALASKATGFPIAKIAAKLAVGYRLDEIRNDITRKSRPPASSRPSITWWSRFPRWQFEKFPGAEPVLGTQMKSVGEVMAIGRTFKQALGKGMRSLETGKAFGARTFDPDADPEAADHAQSGPPRATSASRSSSGYTVERDPRDDRDRSLVPGADVGSGATSKTSLRKARSLTVTPREFRKAKRDGISDRQLARVVERDAARGARRAARSSASRPSSTAWIPAPRSSKASRRISIRATNRSDEADADRPQEGHDSGQRAQPHRAGHRVRLLLLPRFLRAAGVRRRIDHGQLQSRRPSPPTTTPATASTSSR